MRILHAPTNIGGMPFALAKAQRELGHGAVSYIMVPSQYNYSADLKLDVRKNKSDLLRAVWNVFKFGYQFDVFHFYFGKSLTGFGLYDVPVLKLFGKKVFFYFCGSDIRDPETLFKRYPFLRDEHDASTLLTANRDKAHTMATKYADGVFVSTPDLIEFVPRAIWLPQPIDLDAFDARISRHPSTKKGDLITVAHAPTDRYIKGSEFVIKAIQNLQREGYTVELNLIEHMPYDRALEEYAKADIMVDQLLIGWYGQVGVEMMALRKPVICYIRDDLLTYFQSNMPIINADKSNLRDVLRDLIEKKDSWEDIGKRGREYVEKYHDSKKVAKKTLEIYEKAQ